MVKKINFSAKVPSNGDLYLMYWILIYDMVSIWIENRYVDANARESNRSDASPPTSLAGRRPRRPHWLAAAAEDLQLRLH